MLTARLCGGAPVVRRGREGRHLYGAGLLGLLLLLSLPGGLRADALSEALPLVSAGRYVEAQAALAPYVQQNPDDLGARYWLGRALLGAGRREAAVEQFRAVLEKKSSSSETRLYYAQALWELRRPDQALAQLQELLRTDPRNAAAAALQERIKRGASPLPPIQADLGGGGIAFINGGLPLDPGNLELLSYNFRDYTFSNAPADWLITCGTWESTNRWTCSPQWSWYGGFAADGPAAIWTKEEFAGDQVVDTYFGFKMGVDGPQRPYKGGNDVCLTLCGDGANPSSGYTFMIGANHNSSTRIMKGDKILAETSEPVGLFPDWNRGQPSTYQWHRRWWAFRVSKIGERLQLWLDGRLVVEARDPDPLPSGRVGLWVYDNGILVPRLRIFYQALVRPRTEPAGEEAWVTPTTTLGQPPLLLTSASHPSYQNDFEYGLGSWRSLDANTGAVLNLVPGGPDGKGHCLALINRFSGGNFGAMVCEDRLDAREYSRLSFDYRLPPGVKVNLYLAARGRWYEIVFSGRSDPATRTAILGRIPNVVADDQWHRAEFDLLGALEQVLGTSSAPTFQNLHLGNFNNGDYLMAGFGGNAAGATYYVDNFYLGTPRPDPTVKLAWQPAPGAQYSGYAVSLDQNPLGAADKTVAQLPAELKAPGPGRWYVHAQATRQDGSSAGTLHWAVRVAGAAPRVTGADPAAQGQIGGGDIAIRVEDPGGAGVDPRSVAAEINGKALQAGQPGLTVDLQTPAVVVDPAAAGITLKDGGSLQVKLTALADRAGHKLAQPAVLNYTYSAKADRQAPPLPEISLPDKDLLNLDFERDTGGVTVWGGEDTTAIAIDPTTAASGRNSLRVTALTPGSPCGVLLASQPFDAGKYRLLSFDYRFPHYIALNLALNAGGAWQVIRMTDPDTPGPTIGSLAVVADDQWHHAEIDLYDTWRRWGGEQGRSSYQVLQVVIQDSGTLGCSAGARYFLDNVRLSPVFSAAEGLHLAWRSPDLGGIGAISYRLDESANPAPPESAQPPETPLRLAKLTNFAGFLSLRARDNAGNWSPTAVRRVLIDSLPPTAGAPEPAANAHAAPEEIRLALRDQGIAGLDPSSIVLSVAGAEYRVDGRALTYNLANGVLAWSCQRTVPQPTVFPNGQKVEVALRSARDFAGNAVTSLPQWAWVMDYAQDKTGPRLATLVSPSHPTVLSETFEAGGAGPVAALSGCTVQVSNQNPASGQNCLVVKKTAGPLQARLVDGAALSPDRAGYPADKYPMLSFDYRLNNQVRVNLVAEMLGNRYIWALTGPAAGAVGQVPGVQADGQWHKAFVNLAPALRNARRQGALTVNAIYLMEMGGGTPLGAEIGLDNLIVAAAGYGPVVFRWQAADPTGIQGYSYVLTQNPADQPPAQPHDRAMQHTFDTPTPGVWFLRIRAQDGAGNWGPVETYAVVNRNPV